MRVALYIDDRFVNTHLFAADLARLKEIYPNLHITYHLSADPKEEVRHNWYRQRAEQEYAKPSGDDLEIDTDSIVSEGDFGAFVGAWVFVRKPVCSACGEYYRPPEVMHGDNGFCPKCIHNGEHLT